MLHIVFLFILTVEQFILDFTDKYKSSKSSLINDLYIVNFCSEFITYTSLHFLFKIVANSSSHKEVWCPVLRKNVPPIVMMQNKIILKEYLRENFDEEAEQ